MTGGVTSLSNSCVVVVLALPGQAASTTNAVSLQYPSTPAAGGATTPVGTPITPLSIMTFGAPEVSVQAAVTPAYASSGRKQVTAGVVGAVPGRKRSS